MRLEAQPSDESSLSRKHFNTSKVRLEDEPEWKQRDRTARISIPQRCDWKIMSDVRRRCPLHHFNTSKVRLEALPHRPVQVISHHFNTSKVRLEVVSFRPCPSRAARISIPQRCDWKRGRSSPRRSPTSISIPQRCDWKFFGSALSGIRKGRFQYLKGAIGRMVEVQKVTDESNFNTSKVRLEGSSHG